MQLNRYFIAGILTCVIIIAGNHEAYSQSRIFKKNINNGSPEINDGGNPYTRSELEFLQLRNPATGRIPVNIREKELRFAKTLPSKEEALLRKYGAKNYGRVQNYTWTQRGPFNIGGRTRALAIDVNNPNTLLAGGVTGGMWKSNDDGASWKETTSSEDIQSVSCIAQDTRSGRTDTWYYGTGELNYMPGVNITNSASGGFGFDSSLMFLGNGVFKSTDDGNSWAVLPSTETPEGQSFGEFSFVYNIVTDPANINQDEVLAATLGGIMRSTDGGATWDTTLPNLYGIYSNIAVTSKGVFYAVLNYGAFPLWGGIFRSTDGINWKNITPDNFPVNTSQTAIGIAPSNENIVYFLSDTTSYISMTDDGHILWKYTYLSGDGSGSGGKWENRSAGLPSQNFIDEFDSQWGYSLCIKVKPDDENTVFLGEINLYRSTDGFATSSNTTLLNDTTDNGEKFNTDHVDHHAIVFSRSNPNVMYVGGDGGIFKTGNDMDSPPAWTSLNNGYCTTQFYSVAINHSAKDNIIIAGAQDNGTIFTYSNSPTYPWKEIFGGDGTFCHIADDGSSYYVSHQFGNVERITLDDQGNIISNGSIYPPLTDLNQLFILEPYVLDPNDNKVMYYAQGHYIWRNSDVTAIPLNGQQTGTSLNWTRLSSTSTSDFITAIGISKTPADRIYYGTEDGRIFRLDNADLTGSVPVDIYSNKGLPSGAYVFCIAVDQNDGSKAIVSFSNYYVKSLFYTADAGKTWTSVSGNLEQYPDGSGDGPSTRWVNILPVNGSNIYFVGTSTGVYSTASLNGDKTVWALEGANSIGNTVVDAIDARSTDGLVVVATHGRGIFSTHVAVNPISGSDSTVLAFDNNVIPRKGLYATVPNSGYLIANRLTAPVSTFNITKIMYYITADHSGGAGSFYPYEDACINPGGLLTPAPYGFLENIYTPPNIPGWDTVDLSSSPIQVTSSPNYVDKEFFVGVDYDGTHEPAIGYDSISSNGRGWYYDESSFKWSPLDSLGWYVNLYIRAEISTLTAVEDINTKIPRSFTLSQNYPNPFNPSTTIEYDLPKTENVKLIVYDILGREVATLVNADQSPGIYKVRWNGRNNHGAALSSGIYLYSFEAGNYKAVKKMIFLK